MWGAKTHMRTPLHTHTLTYVLYITSIYMNVCVCYCNVFTMNYFNFNVKYLKKANCFVHLFVGRIMECK